LCRTRQQNMFVGHRHPGWVWLAHGQQGSKAGHKNTTRQNEEEEVIFLSRSMNLTIVGTHMSMNVRCMVVGRCVVKVGMW